MGRATWRGAVAAGILLILISVSAFGQANLGRISGSVTDVTGAAVVGATVTVTDDQRGISRTLTADAAGEYSAPNLLPGTYTVRADYKGFQSVERPHVLLEVGKEARIDLVLTPGQENQTITITATPPIVDTTSYTLGGTLSNETINDLPLNGRNYINLVTLRPGMEVYPGGGTSSRASDGLRAEDIGYLIDGVRGDESFDGQSVLNAPIPAGDSSSSLPIDAIQEFNTEENPKAEFGWKPGAIVNAGIKSGTNHIHGTAFAFGRDGTWDARNYFAVAPIAKTPVDLEQFGGSLGGPFLKDKLFWFAAYEGQRYSVGSVSPITTPATGSLASAGNPGGDPRHSLVDACNSVIASGGTITALSAHLAGLNPASCTVAPANFTPGASEELFPTNPSGNPIVLGLVSTNQQDNGVAKIDYHINDRHTLNGIYFKGLGEGTWNDLPSQVSPNWESDFGPVHTDLVAGSWIFTPNSSWVNEFKVGYNRYYAPFLSVDHNVNPTAYGINTGVTNPSFFGFPIIQISPYAASSFRLGSNWPKIEGPDGSLQIVDHVSYLRGKHSFKVGGEFIHNTSTSFVTQNGKGLVKFPDLPSFLTGTPAGGGSKILVGNPLAHLHNYQIAAFLQDDWRATPRLTLNLGLRYELTTVMQEANDLLGNFSPTQGLVQVGKGINSIYNGDHLDFSPRFGMAWDVRGNGKTVVRAGGSLMYEQLPFNIFIAVQNQLGLNQVPTAAQIVLNGVASPGTGTIGVLAVGVPGGPGSAIANGWQNNSLPSGSSSGVSVFPSSVFGLQCGDGLGNDPPPCTTEALDPNLKTPFVTLWSIDIQQELTSKLLLDVGYVANHGSRFVGFTDINEPPLGAGFTAADIVLGDPGADGNTPAMEQAARPYTANGKFPYLASINRLSNIDRSNYQSLQVTLTQQDFHGATFTAGYTYAHALDDSSSNFNANMLPVDSANPSFQYGNSDFDIRHRFTLTGSYDIPGKKGFGELLEGWQVNSIVTLETGLPWSIEDLTNDFSGTDQVNNLDTYGQTWNFSGNTGDFKSGPVPIPCWSNGSGSAALGGCTLPGLSGGAAPPQPCMDAASKLGSATVASLLSTGCYMQGKSVLTPPALGAIGTGRRNIFRDSGFNDWDVSFVKNWKFKDLLTAQLRGEFFNVLNHPIFANPNGQAGLGFNDASVGEGGNFGCGCATPDQAAPNPVLGSGASRSIQVGLKLIF